MLLQVYQIAFLVLLVITVLMQLEDLMDPTCFHVLKDSIALKGLKKQLNSHAQLEPIILTLGPKLKLIVPHAPLEAIAPLEAPHFQVLAVLVTTVRKDLEVQRKTRAPSELTSGNHLV